MNNFKGNLLYLTAVLLAFVWAVGYYGHQTGGAFHLLIVAATLAAYISIWDVAKFKSKRRQGLGMGNWDYEIRKYGNPEIREFGNGKTGNTK